MKQPDNKINIGISIDVQKLIASRMLIQASSGSGKSYLIRKISEELADQKVQQIILDWEGEFISLREKYPFALISKDGGELPLNIRYAEILAHKILQTGISVIVDLSEFNPPERIAYVKRFVNALVDSPKNLWHPCVITIDEAHELCPEGKESESTHAIVSLCSRGRKRGFAAILATQRLSKLKKDASAECRNKLIGITAHDFDRKRAGEELGLVNKTDILNLRKLEPGEFYAFGPAISNDVIKFKVSKVKTSHPESGAAMISIPPTPAAIKNILSTLSDIPAEAEKELKTTDDLRKEVSRLRIELNRSTKPSTALPATAFNKPASNVKNNDLEISRLKLQVTDLTKQLAESQALAKQHSDKTKEFKKVVDSQGKNISKIRQILQEEIPIVDPIEIRSHPGYYGSSTFLQDGIKQKEIVNAVNKNTALKLSGSLPPGEEKILIACAQFPNGLRRDQLTTIVGYKKSSRDVYIGRLKEKGLVAQSGDRVIPTSDGIEKLGTDFEPLPTGKELRDFWMGKLPIGEQKCLQILCDHYPDPVKRDLLTDQTGYMKSSRDVYLGRMMAKELIIVSSPGFVKASENLFD